MRTALALLLLCLALPARAHEWKNELFHCAANIPDSGGWQIIEAPQTPGIAVVLAMQNSAKQSVFGINVVEKYHDASLADPAIQKELEAMLRQFGYQFVGHSIVRAGGFDWLQYPVRAGAGPQQISGVIRYTSAGGYVFSITMLRGGGQEAAQDAELQQAAASFRVLPAGTVAAAPAPAQVASAKGQARPAPVPTTAADAADKPASGGDETSGEDNSTKRMIWIGGAALLILLIFTGIIARKPAGKR
ncbi:MAG: hypothetical protein ABI318_12195 [Chthoniobacteraceae bacterium]